jgi:hypothetical protein
MGVKYGEDWEKLKRTRDELLKLKTMRVISGVFCGGFLEMIAGVHEYGMVIHAKNAKNLCIPLSEKAKGKSPGDFDGLFFITSKNGFTFAVVKKGDADKSRSETMTRPESSNRAEKSRRSPQTSAKTQNPKQDLEFLYLLLPQVTIPERSFIRAGIDEGMGEIHAVIRQCLYDLRDGKIDAQGATDIVGQKCVEMMRRKIDGGIPPPKSKLTMATAKNEKTLYETGDLYNAIAYKTEETGR